MKVLLYKWFWFADTYSDNYIASEQFVGGGIVCIERFNFEKYDFQNNSTEYGGGIFSHNSNINVSNVEFINNEVQMDKVVLLVLCR